MARMTNDEIRATEGGDFAIIDDNYSNRQVEVAIANRAGKAVEAVEEIREEIEELKNNPDVSDIVNTYADLQAYDKSKLTDKDIIRVLNDETHDGNSTYYRYSKASNTFTYIGSSKTYDVFTGTDGTVAGAKGLVPAPATTDAGKFLKADGTWADGGAQSDWAENDPTDPAYIQNRPFYEDVITSQIPQGETVEAGTTPDSGYVWLVEQVPNYDLSEVLSGEDGDTVYMNITYSVNGTPKTDGAEFTLTIENNEAQLDAVAPTGNRWRGAYAMESSGNTTFRFPVSTSDSSATVYITSVEYTKVKKLDGKYLPVDGDTIRVNADGELEADVQGGPTVVQTTGTSTTDVMSQKATTDMIFVGNNQRKIAIGGNRNDNRFINGVYFNSNLSNGYSFGEGSVVIGDNLRSDGYYGVVLGYGCNAIGSPTINSQANKIVIGRDARAGMTSSDTSQNTIAIGAQADASFYSESIAFGYYTQTGRAGELSLGRGTAGAADERVRYIAHVHDPDLATDAANKRYVDAQVGSIETVLATLTTGTGV